MTRLSFVRQDAEGNYNTPTWWASYGGHEKAFAVCYSPAIGSEAVILIHRPFVLVDEHKYTFAAAILQPSNERNLLFTPAGFEIDVADEVLKAALKQEVDNANVIGASAKDE